MYITRCDDGGRLLDPAYDDLADPGDDLICGSAIFKDPILVKSGERRCVNPKWNLRHKASGRRNTIVKAVLVVAVFAVTFTACGKLVDRHVNSDQVTGSFPVTHWLMMGLNQKAMADMPEKMRHIRRVFQQKI